MKDIVETSIQKEIDAWVQLAHVRPVLGKTEVAEFSDFLVKTGVDINDLYPSKWAGFHSVNEFPWSGIQLESIFEDFTGEDPEDVLYAVQYEFESDCRKLPHLHELRSSEGNSAWLMVDVEIQGQLGPHYELVGLFPTLLDAEQWLRSKGFRFTDSAPSGVVDDLSDERIVQLFLESEKKRVGKA